jgi:hypothetical protein
MSGFGDLLASLLTSDDSTAGQKLPPAQPPKPMAPPPAPPPQPAPTPPPMPAAAQGDAYRPPSGWSIAPVQADNKVPYLMPAGWHAAGQPEVPQSTAGQQDAPDNYKLPPGWSFAPVQAAQDAEQRQAMVDYLAKRFGGSQ